MHKNLNWKTCKKNTTLEGRSGWDVNNKILLKVTGCAGSAGLIRLGLGLGISVELL